MCMVKFQNKWKYQSYRPAPGSVAADPVFPPVFVTWSPPGVVTINEGGATGKLVFDKIPIPLELAFQIIDGKPARLLISAVANLGNGKQFANELEGWFVPAKLGEPEDEESNPLVVRGSIVQTSEDIASPATDIYNRLFYFGTPALIQNNTGRREARPEWFANPQRITCISTMFQPLPFRHPCRNGGIC